jgi:hypothetical protein
MLESLQWAILRFDFLYAVIGVESHVKQLAALGITGFAFIGAPSREHGAGGDQCVSQSGASGASSL